MKGAYPSCGTAVPDAEAVHLITLALISRVNQRRRHLFERRHARRSLVIGRGKICPWLETSERSDQAAAR
jgi:hypothetical protein